MNLFQKALNRQPQAVPPIWMMRQAGRYHAHYRRLRERYSFMELCKNADLSSEVALGPILEFDFDAAILFSDLLFPLEALGLGLDYDAGPPRLHTQFTHEVAQNSKPLDEAVRFMHFQKEAMKLTREKLPANKSLVGFIGGTWTLFVYATEGSHSGSLVRSKSQPGLYTKFVEIMAPLLEKNIELQLEGGAEIVMVFDTAAGELSPAQFNTHVLPTLDRWSRMYPGKIGYYGKHLESRTYQQDLKSLSLAGLGFDYRHSMPRQLQFGGYTGFVQGSFDPALLHLDPSSLEKALEEYYQPLLDLPLELRNGWVCGLGHGVLPKTPEENVKRLISFVREKFQR